MNYSKEAFKRYYSENQSTEILALIKNKVDPNIHSVQNELLCIFYDLLTKEPCSY